MYKEVVKLIETNSTPDTSSTTNPNTVHIDQNELLDTSSLYNNVKYIVNDSLRKWPRTRGNWHGTGDKMTW